MKVLLFDVDGTLIRARGAGRKALNRAVFNLHGIRRDCGAMSLAGKTDLRNFKEAIEGALGRPASRAERNALHTEYLRLLPGYVRACVRGKKYILSPGIRRLLGVLGKRPEILLGLGTGNMEMGARIKLEPSGLNDFFRFGGYGSDAYRRSTLLKKAVLRARKFAGGRLIRARDVFVIGDTPLDVAAGKRAGFKTIAVGTGLSSCGELAKAGPDHLAKDFTRTREWLKWING